MNYELTSYGNCWRMRLLHLVAKLLRILIHVDGVPFGWLRPKPRPTGGGFSTGSRAPLLLNEGLFSNGVVPVRVSLCDNMDDFRAKFAKLFKKTAIAQQLTFGFDRP